MNIGPYEVPSSAPLLIAEIGINHNGDVKIAKKMIDKAVAAGAHLVKFQKRDVYTVYPAGELEKPRDVPKAVLEAAIARGVLPPEVVSRLTSSDFKDTRTLEQKLALEFSQSEYDEIDAHCKKAGIPWFASPWDEASVDFLERYDPPCYKIASPSLTDDGLLRHIREKGRPIILSTGMSDMKMIRHAVEVLGTEDLVLLHCTSVYSGDESGIRLVNLRGIKALRKEFPHIPVGFSSHDLGIQPSYAAGVLGAVMIEKHVTLNRAMYGSDQKVSLEFKDLARLALMLKELPIAMGDGEIRFYEEEFPVAQKLRRNWGDWPKDFSDKDS